MIKHITVDTDFSFNGSPFWYKADITLCIGLDVDTADVVIIAEISKYTLTEGGWFKEEDIPLSSASGKLLKAIEEDAIKQASEDEGD